MKSTYNTNPAKTPVIRAAIVTDTNGESLYSIKGEALDDNEKRVKFNVLTDDETAYNSALQNIRENFEAQIVTTYTKDTAHA